MGIKITEAYKKKDTDEIIKIIENSKPNMLYSYEELQKTYRSTFEINNFAKQVLDSGSNYDQIDRHGDEVEIHKQEKFNAREILDKAIELKNSYNTVAIVCKNIEETLLYNQLITSESYNSKFRLVTKNDNVFVGDKIMIIPSYLAKGLEFDAVIISNANTHYYNKNEHNIFYVALTRALHKLELYYTDSLTKLLGE